MKDRYIAAVWAMGCSASGLHHGEAYGNLSATARDAMDICSGHLNPDGTFTTELDHPHKEIIMVRHAESEYNAGLTRNLDSKLTFKGYQQSEQVAFFIQQHIPSRNFVGFVSPLLRCLQTARFIRQKTGIQFTVTPRIAEYTDHYPEEGIDVPARIDLYPEFDWHLIDEPVIHFPREDTQSFIKRLETHLDDAPAQEIIVTHGSPVVTLCEIALGIHPTNVPTWDHSIPNASVSYIKDGTIVWMAREI